ncbi:MAG: DUF2723 domain-containing protein [Bacteroidales bacterium]|nr:DUF2723 domain-containing protein [Bacteroidales bacterium]
MEKFRRLNNIIGWIVFGISAFVYFSTIEPTASWWDCGEYISTAFKLQVGHPPGAPLFQIIGRFFSLFAFGDLSKVAMMVNLMSALCSAFTILFLFWTITMLGLKFIKESEITTGETIAIIGSGLVGALAYTFSDSFWFSAVEGEVYAMSSFFTAIVFWAILRWDRAYDKPHSQRWIILIAYLVGLSIGVHLLNLLAIPAIALVFYYRRSANVNWKGFALTLGVSFFILAFIMFWIIPWTVNLAGKYEIAFVNELGLPFNTGTIFYFLVLFGLLGWGIRFTYRETHSIIEYVIGVVLLLLLSVFSWMSFLGFIVIVGGYAWYKSGSSTAQYRSQLRTVANTAILSMLFILIGYSSFFMLVIRANANTPINENDPSDAVSLLSYLNREQYGTWPTVYGQYYDSPLDQEKPYTDGTPIYIKDLKNGKYVITDDRKRSIPNYDKRFSMIFPRMWSSQKESHIQSYKSWGKVKGIPIEYTNDEGKTETLYKPTFVENMRFFLNYQVGHMYMRYFMWNFAGRQNDIEGHGGIRYGNWISGIPFIDNARLGDQSNLPGSMTNPARNKFYMLPLILGLVGFYFHFKKQSKGALVVLLLFFMTGLAIVMYLNITPYQPRERDYAFAGSFYAFAIWIGFGVLALWDMLKKFNEKILAIVITLACLVLVPGIMAKEGWNDHTRANKYACRDFAVNYLESCAPNAILITNGDNDTFPLWYAQEVEGIRTDVRVVNFMLASGDWYVHQLMRKIYDSDPLPFTLRSDQYDKGVNEVVAYTKQLDERVELQDMINFIASDDPSTKYQVSANKSIAVFPSKKVKITVDSAGMIKNGLVPKYLQDKVLGSVEWDIKSNYLYKNDLMLLDFLAANHFKRPIYFASPSSISDAVDVDKYCYQDGFVYRFLPVVQDGKDFIQGLGSVNSEASYNIMMNKCKWGNLADPKVYVDRESYRNTMIPKQNFVRLGRKLAAEGKYDSAIKVCDYVQQIFPENKVHFDIYMSQFVEVYYLSNAFDKGNKLANRLLDIYEQNADYITSLNPEFRGNYEEDLNQAFGLFNLMKQLAQEYNQPAIVNRVDKYMKMRTGGMN